jgi:hypothetical protein
MPDMTLRATMPDMTLRATMPDMTLRATMPQHDAPRRRARADH